MVLNLFVQLEWSSVHIMLMCICHFYCIFFSFNTLNVNNITAPPVVSSVRVEKLASGIYSGEGEYSGGYEGSSLFSWYRETTDGTISLINGANSKTYEATDADYNSRLLFG